MTEAGSSSAVREMALLTMCRRAQLGNSEKRIEMEKAELILLVLVAVLEVASPELAAIRELFLRESFSFLHKFPGIFRGKCFSGYLINFVVKHILGYSSQTLHHIGDFVF